MAKFLVTIEELVTRRALIEAKNEREAEFIAIDIPSERFDPISTEFSRLDVEEYYEEED
jgi:hypothetical protein